MISVEESRSGSPVLMKDGRYLGSSIDPVREAERWADACVSRIGDARAVVIFGVGSGYHVREFMRRYPRLSILVLEADAEVARQALRLVPEIPRSIILVETDWSKCLEHMPLRAIAQTIFRVLKHVPSCQVDLEFYDRVEALLLARDRAGFFLQLRDRPDLLRSFDAAALEKLGVAPVSVKTVLSLLKTIPTDEASEREALLWCALGELVR